MATLAWSMSPVEALIGRKGNRGIGDPTKFSVLFGPMFPMYEDIERPLLKELHRRGGAARPSDSRGGKTIYEGLGEHFCLTRQDYEETVVEPASGRHRSKWENMVRLARRKLVDRGYLDNSKRGVWKLTPAGRRAADAGAMLGPVAPA